MLAPAPGPAPLGSDPASHDGQTAYASSDGASARLVIACVDADVTSWSAELEPIAFERIAALATSTALRFRSDVALSPRETKHDGPLASQRLEAPHAHARTFFGFAGGKDAPHARACMRLCVEGSPGFPSCSLDVDTSPPASLFSTPPPASLALEATLAAVHHPTLAGGAIALAALAACGLAIVTRKRPGRAA